MTIDMRLDWESISGVRNDLVSQVSLGIFFVLRYVDSDYDDIDIAVEYSSPSVPYTFRYAAVVAEAPIVLGDRKLRLQIHGGNGPGTSGQKDIQYYMISFATWGYYDGVEDEYIYGNGVRIDSMLESAVLTVVDHPEISPIDIREEFGYLTGNYQDYFLLCHVDDKPYTDAVPRAVTRGRVAARQTRFHLPGR